MFRKILFAAMCATAAGYCFAAENLPQVVTSEVFYSQDKIVDENTVTLTEFEQLDSQYADVPAWPLVGSDADVTVACDSVKKNSDNIRIVSKVGADLVVENNFNLGTRGEFMGWSGGANMLHGMQVPAGFDDDCADGAEMPLLSREMLEDDGGTVLSVSRSGRKNCGKYADGYAAFAQRAGIKTKMDANGNIVSESEAVEEITEESEILVAETADAEAPKVVKDQVRSWVVANGQTLRAVLQSWCDKEGWDLVWTTSREYPIQASAVFKGRFVDVASALVRNFGRATPVPYAKFYKGNRVLVISTSEQ
ncbi:MAG: toxin co-regulated pilus biosynthesis Q family protein [Alphaproteobacteria bacterium]|nr:toxin co-regulated pilus biosynthesis Q family protein [Alphaproteobacteria bacterium]